MTVSRSYTCNLCGGKKGGLIGLYWELAKDVEKLVIRPARDVENHLCRNCVLALLEADYPPETGWMNKE